jgi:hypothetical protein
MRLGVPFIAPRDLGAAGAPFGRPWLPSARGCIGQSGAHRTVNSMRAENRVIGWLSVFVDRPYTPRLPLWCFWVGRRH